LRLRALAETATGQPACYEAKLKAETAWFVRRLSGFAAAPCCIAGFGGDRDLKAPFLKP
jgi:hypothetical protein